MTVPPPILSRLDTGRPLLVSGDPVASLRARGVALQGAAALGRLVREHPSAVREHYHQDITSGVDVLACLTGDTIPRALQQIGMPFRSAALTGAAVELAIEAADLTPRPVIVAGVLGNLEVAHTAEDRIGEELRAHAARLAAAGCELILARGLARSAREDRKLCRITRHAAIVSGAMTHLPTWVVVPLSFGGFTFDGEPADACARDATGDGAHLVLFEIPSVEVALGWLDRLLGAAGRVGFALASGSLEPDAWAREARRLIEAGVRVVGGGSGTTQRHLAALSGLLRVNERQSMWPRAV